MSFDLKKFEGANLQARTAEVEVAALQDFFGKDEKPIFVVRGLKGAEIGKANEAKDKASNMTAIVSALSTTNSAEKIDAMKSLLGLDDDVPGDIVRRQEILTFGLISPKLVHSQAVKLSEFFPVEFYNLTNEILKLSGQGGVVGKQKPSGKTAK